MAVLNLVALELVYLVRPYEHGQAQAPIVRVADRIGHHVPPVVEPLPKRAALCLVRCWQREGGARCTRACVTRARARPRVCACALAEKAIPVAKDIFASAEPHNGKSLGFTVVLITCTLHQLDNY